MSGGLGQSALGGSSRAPGMAWGALAGSSRAPGMARGYA